MNHRHALLLIAALLPGAAASRSVAVEALQPLPVPAAQAPILLLVDLSAGQTLFARGAEQPFLPASMTKAMTLLDRKSTRLNSSH